MPRGRKPDPTSRRAQMDALEPGQSCFFVADEGQSASRLMASIASTYRGAESMGSLGLKQAAALIVIEGEIPRAAVRVTRQQLTTLGA